MMILQVVAVGVLSAVLALTLKKQSPEIALVITLAASVLILFMVWPLLTTAVGVVQNLGAQLDGAVRYVGLVLQIVGITYVAELGAQVCADAGETAIASKIEMAGKIIIMAVAAPVLLEVLQMILSIMP